MDVKDPKVSTKSTPIREALTPKLNNEDGNSQQSPTTTVINLNEEIQILPKNVRKLRRGSTSTITSLSTAIVQKKQLTDKSGRQSKRHVPKKPLIDQTERSPNYHPWSKRYIAIITRPPMKKCMSKTPFHRLYYREKICETTEKIPNLLSMQVIKVNTIDVQYIPRRSSSRPPTPVIRYVRRLPSEIPLIPVEQVTEKEPDEMVQTINSIKSALTSPVSQPIIVEISRPNTATTTLINRAKLAEKLIKRPPRRIYNFSRETVIPLAAFG
ncbi:unnamed protein product [Didymodactylos carnosus]|uniref:Uncharacterized protein n=1 Tax=Didymodactylos carnosus TaxID=1234261 RepID=A0A814JG56_9BILA|nr:unnamed protein product [Didymodactylos carnosus]CAF3807015.1 unnamed protein product [Didymodactylos carnosus]